MNEIRLFPWELDSMGEYSCTLPSDTTLWKMWKCDKNAYRNIPGEKRLEPHWVVGQYVPHLGGDPKLVSIRWFEVKLREGPKPLGWVAPDWSNHQRSQAEQKARKPSRPRGAMCDFCGARTLDIYGHKCLPKD